MRASPEGDESDLTDDSYRHEHATGKAYYYKKKSGVEHTTGKGDNTYDSGEESSEYSDSDGEGDSEGDDSDGDTSASDFDGEHSGNGDGEASESTSSVAHPATSSGSPEPDPVKTTQKPAAVIATTPISLSEKTNGGMEVPASPTAPEPPVTATPTKPTKPPSRVSQSSPQRRQGPMRVVSPPSTAKAKLSFIGAERASKASPSVFSKEM